MPETISSAPSSELLHRQRRLSEHLTSYLQRRGIADTARVTWSAWRTQPGISPRRPAYHAELLLDGKRTGIRVEAEESYDPGDSYTFSESYYEYLFTFTRRTLLGFKTLDSSSLRGLLH